MKTNSRKSKRPAEAKTSRTAKRKGDSRAASCSAFMQWFNTSSWRGAGKDAGDLAAASWDAAMKVAAHVALDHKLMAKDQTAAGFYGAIMAHQTDMPNAALTDAAAKGKQI